MHYLSTAHPENKITRMKTHEWAIPTLKRSKNPASHVCNRFTSERTCRRRHSNKMLSFNKYLRVTQMFAGWNLWFDLPGRVMDWFICRAIVLTRFTSQCFNSAVILVIWTLSHHHYCSGNFWVVVPIFVLIFVIEKKAFVHRAQVWMTDKNNRL